MSELSQAYKDLISNMGASLIAASTLIDEVLPTDKYQIATKAKALDALSKSGAALTALGAAIDELDRANEFSEQGIQTSAAWSVVRTGQQAVAGNVMDEPSDWTGTTDCDG